MSLMKWVEMTVVDPKPQQWVNSLPIQVESVLVGSILGLTSKLELVLPHDPKVTEIGVVVLIGIPVVPISDTIFMHEHPIFTNGDWYRRMSMRRDYDYSDRMGGWDCPTQLSVKDGKLIRSEIAKKFGELLL